jgi:hypothetical protein
MTKTYHNLSLTAILIAVLNLFPDPALPMAGVLYENLFYD